MIEQQGWHPLSLRVNDNLVLDAGGWEETTDARGYPIRLVHAPKWTMFEQLIDYLEGLPSPSILPRATSIIQAEAHAAAVLCLRWGSYFAVLADHDKPLASIVGDEKIRLIDVNEMHRINVEASAALGQLINLMETDYNRYRRLVDLAMSLPLPKQRYVPDDHWRAARGLLMGWSTPEAAAHFEDMDDNEVLRHSR